MFEIGVLFHAFNTCEAGDDKNFGAIDWIIQNQYDIMSLPTNIDYNGLFKSLGYDYAEFLMNHTRTLLLGNAYFNETIAEYHAYNALKDYVTYKDHDGLYRTFDAPFWHGVNNWCVDNNQYRAEGTKELWSGNLLQDSNVVERLEELYQLEVE